MSTEGGRISGGGISGLDRTIVRDSVISASGVTNVIISVGAESQVTCVSFTVGRGQVAVGDRGLVADCQINSGGPPTFVSGSGAVLQAGVGAVLRNCAIAAGTTVGTAAISVGSGTLLTGCTVDDNGAVGIIVGNGSVVENCVSTNNTSNGCTASDGAVIRGCRASGNGNHGVSANLGARIENCTAASNTSNGIIVGNNSTVSGSTAMLNGLAGISSATMASISHCAATSNTGTGITAGDGSMIAHSTAVTNQGAAGINAGFGCTIARCVARANTNSGTSSFGITVGGESTVIACTVTNNTNSNATLTSTTGGGISVGTASTVKDCTVQGNKGDGIRASSLSHIIGNTCDANGFTAGDGAGIHTVSAYNRIERNTVTGSDRGIDVDSFASLIISNSASGNTTNYDIAAENRYGPIVNIIATGTAAVSGSSAASTLTTTDPHANFAH